MVFPEECLQIVQEKLGDKVRHVVLTGLGFQLPHFTNGVLERLEVRDVTVTKGKKKVFRRTMLLCPATNQ